MDIGEGYRWNVPVVTYAFDQSFIDYFGSNGVAAVEQAIAILNELPPASEITLTNFPEQTLRVNFQAQEQQLYDLKSATLALLLDQMGLGAPTRNVFDLRRFDPIFLTQGGQWPWPAGTIPELIIERNFDPEMLAATQSVNGVVYTGDVRPTGSGWDVNEFVGDLQGPNFTSIADLLTMQPAGRFGPGLTRDDVGGLRYLLSTNIINFETLLSDVHGRGTNSGNFVGLALRPGVEKVTFVPQQYDSVSGESVPITNQFTDTFITNNTKMHQLLERVITQPDFLFSLGDSGAELGYTTSGTSNWWNSAVVAGTTNQLGPGVIRPPVKIAFDKRGPNVGSVDGFLGFVNVDEIRWASFDGSANSPTAYPESANFNGADHLSIHFRLTSVGSDAASQLNWQAPVALGGSALLQTATNLTDWVSVATVTNYGGAVVWTHLRSGSQGYFRVVPQ